MNDIVTELRKIPPVTRLLCGSLLGVTGPIIMGLVSAYKVLYDFPSVFNKFQIWRLYTSYFLGSGGINFIFEFVMLYRSTNEIESGPYMNKSADLLWQLLFAAASINVMSIPLNSRVFFRPLLHCLGYLSSALAPPGAQTSMFGLVTLPIKYLPYVMLGMELLMGGTGAAAACIPGAVVGHLWWWGVWGSALGGGGGVLAEYARAPQWLEKYLGDRSPAAGSGPGAGRGANQGGGVHVIPPRRFASTGAASTGPAAPGTAARSGGGSGGGGYNWGSGHRLGNN